MTIRRYSSKEGFPISLERDAMTQVLEILGDSRNNRSAVDLPAGQYDVTPEGLGDRRCYNYDLIVHKDGTGTMRQLPVDGAVVSIGIGGGEPTSMKRGGRVYKFPGDAIAMPITGPAKDGRSLRAYEIITYYPGRSPEKK